MGMEPINELTHGFLSNFSIEDLKLVKSDLELVINHKMKLFLAIETYDIVNYYTPFIDKRIINHPQDAVKRGIIMYEEIFNSLKNNEFIYPQILLVKQYAYELFFIKNGFENKLKNIIENKNELIRLKKELPDQIKEIIKDAKNITPEQFEKLTLYLILIKKGISTDDFYKFLREKIVYYYDLNDVVANGIDTSLHSLETNREKDILNIYKSFANIKTKSKHHLSESEYHKSLINSHKDIQVVFSIIDYNNIYNNDFNTIFLYISSATKSQPIATLFKDNHYFPTIKHEENYNIIRNIRQIFLVKILLDNYLNNPKLNVISLLSDLIKSKQEEKITTIEVFDLINSVANRYNKFETHFYFKAYTEYKNTLNTLDIKFDNGEIDNIKFVDNLISDTTISFDFEKIAKDFNKKISLSSLFYRKSNLELSINFGNDIIRNSFHHLPYLLFISPKSSGNRMSNDMYKFLYLVTDITESNTKIAPNMNTLLKSIGEHIIKNFDKQYLIEDYIRNVIIEKCVYVLLNRKGDAENKESNVLNELMLERETLIAVHSRSATELGYQKNDLRMIYTKHYLIREINYVILWFLRRNNQNPEAVILGENMIDQYNDDGRFYHGLALAKINVLYNLLNDITNNFRSINDILEKTNNYLIKALACYEKLIDFNDTNKNNLIISKLVRESISAIYNTIVDLSIREFEVQRKMDMNIDYNILLRGERYIDKNKAIISKLGKKYTDYPICNITEAELQYFEALYFCDNNDKVKAWGKISLAYTRCGYCIDKEIIPKRFSEKISAIKSLKNSLEEK